MKGPSTSNADELPRSDLAEGDLAASDGNWPDAIAAWERALSGTDSVASAERIRWFLSQHGIASAPVRSDGQGSRVLAAGGLALTGTALVFLAEIASNALAIVLSVCAWIAYVAAVALSLLYARSSNAARNLQTPPPPAQLAQAIECANLLAKPSPNPDASVGN